MQTVEPMDPPATTRVGRRLLAAADTLFYDRGITAVGVDLLAEHAGTTKRTLYQRFGSKDGLVAAYLRDRAHRWQVTVVEALAAERPSDAASAVAVVLSTAETWASDNPRGCAFVNAWAELGTTGSDGVAVIVEEKRWMRALLAELVGDDELAAELHLAYEGAHVAWSTLSDPEAYRRAEDVCRRLLAAQGSSSSSR